MKNKTNDARMNFNHANNIFSGICPLVCILEHFIVSACSQYNHVKYKLSQYVFFKQT